MTVTDKNSVSLSKIVENTQNEFVAGGRRRLICVLKILNFN